MLTALAQRAEAPQADPSAPAVSVDHIFKSYGETVAVRDVSFETPRGHIFALLGPSGGGKTTTLRIIAGFENPDAGTVAIGGETIAMPGKCAPPERRRVGMIFQDYALFPHLNVRQNIAFGVPRGPRRDRTVDDVIDWVGLSSVAHHMPHQLSGGQQQRVALARALAPNPSVVLLDEPFSNLDPALRQRVRSEVRQILREAHTTAIFVTHDQAEALAIADTVGVMIDHAIIQAAAPQDLYFYPESLAVAEFFGETNVLDGHFADGRVECALGALAVGGAHPPAGPVKVSIRPESIRLRPEFGPSTEAVVTAIEFRGAYKAITARLDTGQELTMIMGLHTEAAIGERAAVGVNGVVAAFPV